MVSSDHDDLNPSALAHVRSVGDGSLGRVNQGDEPHKAEIFHREIHVIHVELEPFGKLFIWQKKVAETQHTLAQAA